MKTLLPILALFAVSAFAQNAAPCNSPESVQEPVVSVMRAINTNEVNYAMQKDPARRFATLNQLFESGLIRTGGHFGSISDPVPGYAVSMVVSGDGQHYFVSILKKEGDCSHIGVMSSEVGIIYLVQPIH